MGLLVVEEHVRLVGPQELRLVQAKAEFLRAYQADVFFDDQEVHCDDASSHVATGHVPHGVANQGG